MRTIGSLSVLLILMLAGCSQRHEGPRATCPNGRCAAENQKRLDAIVPPATEHRYQKHVATSRRTD